MGVLNGKVAVVTGASKGIGAGIAKKLAAEGAAVVLNYGASREDAEKQIAEITKNGGKAIAVQGSVANSAEVVRVFEEAKKAYGKVDILVNNAGVYAFAPLAEVQEAEFHREFNTNVLGAILSAKEALKYFPEEGGSIVNIGSAASTLTAPGSVIYSATKAALDAVTGVLSKELGPKIRVNSVNPGPVVTEGYTTLGFKDSEFEKQFVGQMPLKRVGSVEEVADAVLFLASDASRWITGEKLVVAGGLR
ncbi:glucose 1-dehydrogenase [Terriglobus albidus]|uniref:Glucose 1-dehydrogenase n=1 Tax=Terriglobus albidus TaxID=1592106 RepID=A0A5B9EDD2_9BACT|nr:glucose 1-dehydrogenase [Terriglobus albidus]QEE30193.1 glucose 1-dehydrogenase [Terriglobus albidus]